jgi:hypothetical protein
MTPIVAKSARWLREPVLIAALACWLGGCAGQPVPPAPAQAPGNPEATPSAAAPPEWRPGDRWVYGWTSATGSGTKTVEMVEIRDINAVSYYIIRIGDVDYFYTRDLRWAGSMQKDKIVARMTPPQPWFTWPLETGRRWTHEGLYEDPSGKVPHKDVFSVVGSETVEVPAGRFETLKIVRETDRRDSDQYWYAPSVRFYVRWIGRRGDSQFQEELRQYQPASRLIPSQPTSPPSGTR